MPSEYGEVLEKWDIINANYPIVGMKIHQGAIEVVREARGKVKHEPPKDNKITRLSKKSLSRLAFVVTTTKVKFKSLLTLTYENIPTNGRQVKSQLNRFLTYLRRRFRYHKLEYLWFLEFQKRGAPHFHVLLNVSSDIVSRETILQKWVDITGGSKKAERVTKHKRSWENIQKQDGAKRYALKYALKPEQKQVPRKYRDVGRFWGCSRGVKTDDKEIVQIDEKMLRGMIECLRPDFNDRCNKFVPKYVFLPSENLS